MKRTTPLLITKLRSGDNKGGDLDEKGFRYGFGSKNGDF
jgi:hypothetical protein